MGKQMTDWEGKYKQLVESIKCVIESYDYMVMTDDLEYSFKNQRCKHGNPGYNGCESCAVEFLMKAIEYD